jgi:hypothetical protein
MKIKLTLALLLVTVFSYAQPGNYKYKRKLDSVTTEGYYFIPLSPEVVSKSKSRLDDIRLYQITDTDTIEIPYLIEKKGDRVEAKELKFDLINSASNLKCCSFITLKMNKKQLVNTIHIDVDESNFDKQLTIEGSSNNKEWFTIKTHIRIVGFTSNTLDFKSTSIDFDNAEYEYFRIKFDDDSSEKIKVKKAFAYESIVKKGEYEQLKIHSQTQTENKKEKTSEIVVDLANSLMVNYLELKCDSTNDFYRNINIYKSNGTYPTANGSAEAWQLINTGILASDRENKYMLNNVQSNRFKIEIVNHDNQPIKLSEIKMFAEFVGVVAKLPSNAIVYLCYGKEGATAPVYDIVHFKDKIPAENPSLGYGKEEAEIKKVENKSALIGNKIWLWISLATVATLLAVFAFKMLKSEQADT